MIAAACVLFVIGFTSAFADEATRDYVVRDGDTCAAIAQRELGDRGSYRAIHALNPGLGKLPHLLTPGTVLRLPARRTGADARLAGAQGTVRVRPPGHDIWEAGKRGMDLFRAWRVNTAERSTASLRFHDDSELAMRENSIVIVYGSARSRDRVSRDETVLERGALRARLGELRGVNVRMPSGEAQLGPGRVVVEVDESGSTALSVHAGRPVALRGSTGAPVAVGSGMGTRVDKGRAPERPRPLPSAPRITVDTPRLVVAAGGVAALDVTWEPVATAASYHVEFVHDGEVVGTATVAASVPLAARLSDAPAGAYEVRVAARTKDGLESRPAVVGLQAIDLAIVPPGAPPVRFPQPRGSGGALIAARGSRLVAYGAACAGDDGVFLDRIGVATVRCTAPDGRTSAPVTIEVVDITASVSPAPDGSRRLLDLSSAAPLGEALLLVAGAGAQLEGVERTATGFTFDLVRVGAGSGTSQVAVHDRSTGQRLIAVTVD